MATAKKFDAPDIDQDELRETRREARAEQMHVRGETRRIIQESDVRVQAKNREARNNYELRQKMIRDVNVRGGSGRLYHGDRAKALQVGPEPKYTATSDGDLFGEGRPTPAPDPSRPADTRTPGKDKKPGEYVHGQSPKVSYNDVAGSRFQAPFETKEFKNEWFADQLGKQGYTVDNPNHHPGYQKVFDRLSSQWRNQYSEWQTRKQEHVRGWWKDGQNPAPTAPTGQPPAQSIDTQVQTQTARARQAGQEAAAAPAPTAATPAPTAATPAPTADAPTADAADRPFNWGAVSLPKLANGLTYNMKRAESFDNGTIGSVGIQNSRGEFLGERVFRKKDTGYEMTSTSYFGGKNGENPADFKFNPVKLDPGTASYNYDGRTGVLTTKGTDISMRGVDTEEKGKDGQLLTEATGRGKAFETPGAVRTDLDGNPLTKHGRYIRGGQIFFGSDSALSDYKKKQGIL